MQENTDFSSILQWIPCIVYNFNNKNLIVFEDSIIYKGDLLLVASWISIPQLPPTIVLILSKKELSFLKWLFLLSTPAKLNLDRVIVQRSFGYTHDYFTSNQMECINVKLFKQLKDCAICIS